MNRRRKYAVLGLILSLLPATTQTTARSQDFHWVAASGNWSDRGNWNNPTIDDSPRFLSDAAFIDGNGVLAYLTEEIAIGRLDLSGRASVYTGLTAGHRLRVAGSTTLDGISATLHVFDSPAAVDFETYTLSITNTSAGGGGLVLNEGAVAQINQLVSIAGTGFMKGSGTLLLNTDGGNLQNDGKIIVGDGGTLRIEGAAGNSGVFDWDGVGGRGEIEIRANATLDIDLTQGGDAFGGTIVGVDGAVLDNAVAWTLDTLGVLRGVEAKFGFDSLEIRGGQLTNRGWIDASAGLVRLESELNSTGGRITLGSTSAFGIFSVNDGMIGPGTTMELVNGNFAVGGGHAFTIDQSGRLFDWDGNHGAVHTVINGSADLTVIADAINPNTGSYTENRYSGIIRLDGRLTVYGVGPDLLIAKTAGQGDAMITMKGSTNPEYYPTYDGVPIVFGGDSTYRTRPVPAGPEHFVQFNAPVRFDGGAVDLASNTTVLFNDRVEFRASASKFVGDGSAAMRFHDVVVVNTTAPFHVLFATEFAATSSTTLVSGAHLLLEGPTRFYGGDFYGGAGRTMSLVGDAIVDGGVTSVNVETADLDGYGSTTTRIENPATLDLNVARLDVSDDRFDGTLDIRGTLDVENAADEWQNHGTVLLNGGRIAGTSRFRNQGDFRVEGSGDIAASIVLDAGSTNTINGTLTLQEFAVLNPAAYQGSGTIRNEGRLLTLEGADLGSVSLVNDSLMNLGYVAGSITTAGARAFTQTADGTLLLQIAGNGDIGGMDVERLSTTASIQLDGTLSILTVGGFTPIAGDAFTILSAGTGGVEGEFANSNLPRLGSGLFWDIFYNPNSVVLEVVDLVADTDNDGDVDGSDFLQIQRTDPRRIPEWEKHYGRTASVSATLHAVPEPRTVLLAVLVLAACRNRSTNWRRGLPVTR